MTESGAVPSCASSAGVHGGPAGDGQRPAAIASSAPLQMLARASGLRRARFFRCLGGDLIACGVELGEDPRGEGETGGPAGANVPPFLRAREAEYDD